MRYWDGREWTDHVATAPPPSPVHNEFGRRVLGFFVDCLIFGIASAIIGTPQRLLEDDPIWLTVCTGALLTGTWFAYQFATARRWGATPGMQLVGLKIEVPATDMNGSFARRASVFAILLGAPGMVPGAAGEVVGFATFGVLLFSCLAVLWNRDGLAWHDRFSGTTVVRAVPEASLRVRRIVAALAAIGVVTYLLLMIPVFIRAFEMFSRR